MSDLKSELARIQNLKEVPGKSVTLNFNGPQSQAFLEDLQRAGTATIGQGLEIGSLEELLMLALRLSPVVVSGGSTVLPEEQAQGLLDGLNRAFKEVRPGEIRSNALRAKRGGGRKASGEESKGARKTERLKRDAALV